MLNIDRVEQKLSSNPNQGKFNAFASKTLLIREGYHGMVQFHFKNQDQADSFVSLCQQQASLTNLNIHKASVQHNRAKNSYIVRLTQTQCQILYGDNYFSKLQKNIAPQSILTNNPVERQVGFIEATETIEPSPPPHQPQTTFNKVKFIKLLYHATTIKTWGNNTVEICFTFLKNAKRLSRLWQPALPIRTTYLLRRSAVLITEEQLQAVYPEASSPLATLEADKYSMSVSFFENLNGENNLSNAAANSFDPKFQELVENSSPEAISCALVIQGNKSRTALHYAATHQDSKVFITLINKVSAQAINTALIQQDDNGWTPLHAAACNQSSEAFITLINKASPAAINMAITKAGDEGWTGLHLAASNQISESFITLITKASSEALNDVVSIQDCNGWTVLHKVARSQFSGTFIALVDKISPEVLDAALVIQDNNGSTGLQVAVRHLPSDAIHILIAKASPEALDTALAKQAKDKTSTLHIAARYLASDAFSALVTKTSAKALNRALNNQDDNGWSPLELAIRHQSNQALSTLFDKVKPSVLKTALMRNICSHVTPLHYVIMHLDTDLVYKLIGGLNASELASAIANAKQNNQIQKRFFKTLARHFYTKHHAELVAAVKPYFSILYPFLCELYFVLGHWQTNPMLDQEMVDYLLQHKLGEYDKIFLYFFIEKNKQIIHAYERHLHSILDRHISNKGKERLSQHYSNLASLFHAVQQQGQYKNIPIDVVKQIRYWIRLQEIIAGFKPQPPSSQRGCISNQDRLNMPISYSQDECIRMLRAGKGLIKIIKPVDWQQMLAQLCDYNYRPRLRKISNHDRKCHHKLVHLTGEIVPYNKKRRTKTEFHFTKKTSATLIAAELCTPVFGHHHLNRDLVGLLFNAEHCQIKAMLSEDCGTYHKKWIGLRKDIKDYRSYLAPLTFFKAHDFKRAISGQSSKVNEVLAKLSREALKAIIMARDTPKSRKIALHYRHDIKETLGLTLPIYRYDACYRTIREIDPYLLAKNVRESAQPHTSIRMAS